MQVNVERHFSNFVAEGWTACFCEAKSGNSPPNGRQLKGEKQSGGFPRHPLLLLGILCMTFHIFSFSGPVGLHIAAANQSPAKSCSKHTKTIMTK